MPGLRVLSERGDDLSRRIDLAVSELWASVDYLVDAEQDYRHTRAEAWKHLDLEGMTAKQKEDAVDAAAAPARRERDRAELNRQNALETLRSRRAQLAWVETLITQGTDNE